MYWHFMLFQDNNILMKKYIYLHHLQLFAKQNKWLNKDHKLNICMNNKLHSLKS